MKAQTEKNTSIQAKAVADAAAAQQLKDESGDQFEDRRVEVAAQRKLAGMAEASPQACRITQMQAVADGSAVGTVQREITDEEDDTLQSKAIQKVAAEEEIQPESAVAQKMGAQAPNNTGLPDTIKSGIENLSGLSLDDVKVHYNSPKPAQLQAHAFAQGADIHMAPGQEKHLPHEAWHVVQQKQGRVRPTMQMKGKVKINDDAGLEKEADVMGAKAASHKAPKPIQSDPFKIREKSQAVAQRRVVDQDGKVVDEAVMREILRGKGYRDDPLKLAMKLYERLHQVSRQLTVDQALEEISQRVGVGRSEEKKSEDGTGPGLVEAVLEDKGEADADLEPVAEVPRKFDAGQANTFRAIMKNVPIESEWDNVRLGYQYAMGQLEFDISMIEEQMKALLAYRRFETVAEAKDNPHSVMEITYSSILPGVLKRVNALRKTISQNDQKQPSPEAKAVLNSLPNPEKIGEPEERKKVLEWDDAGGGEPTSDIDLNLVGFGSEEGSITAFDVFRTRWGAEPGKVFDVNYYGRDWKPTGIGKLVDLAEKKKSEGENEFTQEEAENAGAKWELGAYDEAGKTEERVVALAHLLKELGEKDKAKLESLAKGGALTEDLVSKSKEWVKSHESAIAKKMEQTGASKATSENKVYADKLTRVQEIRNQILVLKLQRKLDEAVKQEGILRTALHQASMAAPEAYMTSAAFQHGVINKQILSTTFAEGKPKKANLKLDADQLFNVILENVAFSFHVLKKMEEPGTIQVELKMQQDALGKYVYRATNAFKHLENVMAVSPEKSAHSAQVKELRYIAKSLVQIINLIVKSVPSAR